MYEKTGMLFIYVETPLHAGSGRGLGAVDLPIQRERTTAYPMIQASSVKGKLRAEVRTRNGWADNSPEIEALFGKAGSSGENFAGAIAPGDARLLLFPVRSLAGIFAWTTSRLALQRFIRDCALTGLKPPQIDSLPTPNAGSALIASDDLKAGEVIVLEEFSFAPQIDNKVAELGQWIAGQALPADYTYWREAMPKKLAVLPDDAFRDFALYATEVQTHVRLDPARKTVESGALWTTELLPVDTLLYAPLMVMSSRVNGQTWSANRVFQTVQSVLDGKRVQFGGDETTGQGWTSVRLVA